MFDLSITPEQYKDLWWKNLVREITKTKKCFTMSELEEFVVCKSGSAPSNFSRIALVNAPIMATGITTKDGRKAGRPGMYYCSTLLD